MNRVETVAGVVFALCDSSVPGHAEGRLDGTLAEEGRLTTHYRLCV